jgi:pre-mRNA-splicing helicase BRR2
MNLICVSDYFLFQILVSTATLAWGVNLPAQTVIIKGTEVFDSDKQRMVDVKAADIMQMMGRAGRPQFDVTGNAILITEEKDASRYGKEMERKMVAESYMTESLQDHLNAEIVLGSITNEKDALNWLTYTFLWVRMKKTPDSYLPELDKPFEDRCTELIKNALKGLSNLKMIDPSVQSGNISSWQNGKIASYYYITCKTMRVIVKTLNEQSGYDDLCKVLSAASDFKAMHIREGEESVLKKLKNLIPIPIKLVEWMDKQHQKEAQTKTSMLFQVSKSNKLQIISLFRYQFVSLKSRKPLSNLT